MAFAGQLRDQGPQANGNGKVILNSLTILEWCNPCLQRWCWLPGCAGNTWSCTCIGSDSDVSKRSWVLMQAAKLIPILCCRFLGLRLWDGLASSNRDRQDDVRLPCIQSCPHPAYLIIHAGAPHLPRSNCLARLCLSEGARFARDTELL